MYKYESNKPSNEQSEKKKLVSLPGDFPGGIPRTYCENHQSTGLTGLCNPRTSHQLIIIHELYIYVYIILHIYIYVPISPHV